MTIDEEKKMKERSVLSFVIDSLANSPKDHEKLRDVRFAEPHYWYALRHILNYCQECYWEYLTKEEEIAQLEDIVNKLKNHDGFAFELASTTLEWAIENRKQSEKRKPLNQSFSKQSSLKNEIIAELNFQADVVEPYNDYWKGWVDCCKTLIKHVEQIYEENKK